MATYQYSTPYSGIRVAPLPPGYMEAATAPGRNLAAGIASAGKDIGDAMQKAKEEAKAAKGLRELIGIYAPEMKEQAQAWSKSEAEGFIRGKILQMDAQDRKAEQDRRQADEQRRAKLFPLQEQAAQLGVDQGKAALSETQRQAQAMAEFNRMLGGMGPDPVATAAGAMADPRSGINLSSLRKFAGANPVVPQLTPEMVMRLAAASGALTPQMATQLSQLDNPLARMRAQADATQATAYAKQVDTSAATRNMPAPEIQSVDGRDFMRSAQGWEPLSQQPFATMTMDDPETGGQIRVPISREEFQRRMEFQQKPTFKGGQAEESAWMEAKRAIAQRPDLREAILKRLRANKFTTEGL